MNGLAFVPYNDHPAQIDNCCCIPHEYAEKWKREYEGKLQSTMGTVINISLTIDYTCTELSKTIGEYVSEFVIANSSTIVDTIQEKPNESQE